MEELGLLEARCQTWECVSEAFVYGERNGGSPFRPGRWQKAEGRWQGQRVGLMLESVGVERPDAETTIPAELPAKDEDAD